MAYEIHTVRHEVPHAFPIPIDWEALNELAILLPASFNIMIDLIDHPQEMEQALSLFMERIVEAFVKVYSLAAFKISYVNDRSGMHAGHGLGKIYFPKLNYWNYVLYLGEEKIKDENAKKELDQFLVADPDYQQDVKITWLATFLSYLVIFAAHELYHARQFYFLPNYCHESSRANWASEVMDKDSPYARDLGERSARAAGVRALIELSERLSREKDEDLMGSSMVLKYVFNQTSEFRLDSLRSFCWCRAYSPFFAPRKVMRPARD